MNKLIHTQISLFIFSFSIIVPKTFKIMKSLSLPRKLNNSKLIESKIFLKKKISKKLYKELLILEKLYNKKTYNLI